MKDKCIKILKDVIDYFAEVGVAIGTGFVSICKMLVLFVKQFIGAIKEGDLFTRLSLLWMGAGYFKRKQYVKSIIITVIQVAFFVYLFTTGVYYLSKFPTLGTVKFEPVFNVLTGQNEFNDYDHSFKILLYGVITILFIIVMVVFYMMNVINALKLQKRAAVGRHINTFKEDVAEYKDKKFHTTLLFLPCLGVIIFTIIPLIVMICVAFTNYDQPHMPPANLFTWVGVANFKKLFANSMTITFGYSFRKILSWTLIWAVTATFTTYFGGILLAMFINNKKTKLKGFWRTCFVVTIAVPQFVSLLLVRNFFADSGIVNTICSELGVTSFLKSIGLVSSNLSYIPFLTNPTWCKIMIILINIWVGVPYLMLQSTGILMNIPEDLYESAKMDGASGFKMFTKITMPYMLFVTGPSLITSIISNINNFNVIYLLTQDVFVTLDQALANSNAKEVDLLVTWLFRLTQEYYNYKMASVVGIVVFVLCLVITLLAFNVTIRGDKEEKFQL